jgi:hypothetical protein
LLDRFAEELTSSPDMDADEQPKTLWEWTQAHRVIKAKDTGDLGPFSLQEYPYLADVYKRIGELEPGERAVIRKAAQIGATELALNLSFYVLDGRGSVFYALPPGPTQGDFAHARVDPAISASPHITAMASAIDNVGLKTFAGGFNFYIRGTAIPKGDPQRAAQLSEAPADLAVIDEFDRVPPAAIPLVRDRLGDSRLRWELALSTPTYPDIGIDAEYQGTSQHEPQVRCQGEKCGQWHWLDWSLVRGPTADDSHARLICPTCGHVIERAGMWERGRARWQPRHPERGTLGFWIPKLASERADLDEAWEQSQRKRDLDRQAFWNGWMGLPYEPKGARLTRELIAACAAPAERYSAFPAQASWTAMGVDVGLELHYWIKARLLDGSGRERAVAIGSALSWRELDVLMHRYGVQRCVVDDNPELREDVAFQNRHRGKVWLAQYVDSPGADLARWDRKRGVVKIERTKGLEEASAKIQLGIDELPADWENVPELVEHLCTNIKAKRVREDGSTQYHFPRTGKPDHLHHAKTYCEVALSILPPHPGRDERDPGSEVPATGREQYLIPGSMRGRL